MSAEDKQGQDANTDGQALTMTHPQCINRLQEIRSAMGAIAELNQPTTEDSRYFVELEAEFDNVDAYRQRLERSSVLNRIEEAAKGLSGTRHMRLERGSQASGDGYDRDPVLNPDSIEAKRFRNPWDLSEMRTFDRSQQELVSEYRSRALSAIEQMQGATDNIRAAATGIVEKWDDEDGKLSRLALALSEPTYLRAWSKLARSPLGADLSKDEQQAVDRVKTFGRAMSLTDSAGGYLVPFQLDPTVILTSDGSINQIRQLARQVVATGDVWNGVSSGDVSWSYDAEAAEVSDDATTFAQPTVPIYKAQGFVPISREAFQDAANVTAEVGRLLARGRDTLEAQAFATGTGSGQPTGIVTALVAAGGSVVVNSATTDTFALADVYALDTALPARYHQMPTAGWLGTRGIYNKIRQFDTAGGAGLFADNLREGIPGELMNHPVMISEAMDGVINSSAENYVLIVGDWENYVIADRIGMTVDFVPHLFGTNRRPTNQSGWLAYARHGAAPTNTGAFRLLDVT